MSTIESILTDEQARKKHEQQMHAIKELNKRIIQANTLLEQKQRDLLQAKKEAEAMHGSSDLNVLRQEVINRRASNQKILLETDDKIACASKQLEDIDSLLRM